MRILYVVLAAGSSSRMGHDKPVTPLAGRSPLARLHATLGDRRAVVVTCERLAAACAVEAPGRPIVVNPHPESGMTASLRAAAALEPAAGATLAVVPADKPLVSRTTLERCEAALERGADVVFPVAPDGAPGHPVYFAARAVARLPLLPDGDTLRRLRDDDALARVRVAVDDPGAFADLDTPEDWRDAEAALHA